MYALPNVRAPGNARLQKLRAPGNAQTLRAGQKPGLQGRSPAPPSASQIAGGPNWFATEKWDIDAKSDDERHSADETPREESPVEVIVVDGAERASAN